MSNDIKSIVDSSKLIEFINNLPLARQIPVDKRMTVEMTNPETGKKFVPKTKAVEGIEEDRSITWSFANFTSSDDIRWKMLAKKANITAAELGARIIMGWFEDNREAIYEFCGDVNEVELSEEDIDKKMKALQKQIEKLTSLRSK